MPALHSRRMLETVRPLIYGKVGLQRQPKMTKRHNSQNIQRATP